LLGLTSQVNSPTYLVRARVLRLLFFFIADRMGDMSSALLFWKQIQLDDALFDFTQISVIVVTEKSRSNVLWPINLFSTHFLPKTLRKYYRNLTKWINGLKKPPRDLKSIRNLLELICVFYAFSRFKKKTKLNSSRRMEPLTQRLIVLVVQTSINDISLSLPLETNNFFSPLLIHELKKKEKMKFFLLSKLI